MSQKLKQLKEKLRKAITQELVEYDNINTQKEDELEERLNLFVEKNTPTNPSKWSYYKSQAKKKFDVYPSAYANAWAAKMYKGAGGGWRKSENIDEASMTGNLDGGEGPPKTPYAFQSKKKRGQDKKKEDEISTNSTGFTKVNEVVKKEVDAINKVLQNLKKLRQNYIKIYNMGDKTLKGRQFNKYYESILNAEKEITHLTQLLDGHLRGGFSESINEGRYHEYRNDESLTPKQKIGRSMREIRDALNELDRTVKMNLKLKTELKIKSEDYWKNTHKALTKISERLVKMANKVGNLK